MTVNKNSKIYIAGHCGMVGSSIWRNLESRGYTNLLGRTSKELDLRNQHKVEEFFIKEKPDFVILAAAKVGGILANSTFRAEFIYDNIQLQNNVINQSYLMGVKKLLFFGSSCIYPKLAPQPIKEECLLTGSLEKTNEPYAIAKIAGLKMCENYFHQYQSNFISLMPTNLYGPGDNFELKSCHVIPALIRKFHDAKTSNVNDVEIWGSGNPKREFLHVDDLAEACVFILENIEAEQIYLNGLTHINVGSGIDISIKNLARTIMDITGFIGNLSFNVKFPDGTPRKLLNTSFLNKLGWKPSIKLKSGLSLTYEWYKKNYS